MRRVGILAAAAVCGAVFAGEASAQILGPTIIGPTVGPAYGPTYVPMYVPSGSTQLRRELARRELQREALFAAALRRGLTPEQQARLDRLERQRARDARWSDGSFFGAVPPVVFLPPDTRAAIDPFGGSPSGGNYYYWLSREYAKGRISKSEYDRQVYGIGRK